MRGMASVPACLRTSRASKLGRKAARTARHTPQNDERVLGISLTHVCWGRPPPPRPPSPPAPLHFSRLDYNNVVTNNILL